MSAFTRRRLIGGAGLAGAGLLLPRCDRLNDTESVRETLRLGERVTMTAQRLVTDRTALAREYDGGDISPIFRANGTRMPTGADYAALLANGFRDWRLVIDGMVARPLSLSLAQLGAMPARSQTTRHDCVEGWSAIGRWTGTPLKLLLDAAGVRNTAGYLIFHCADLYGARPYYESIDMIDALHPQTILAWALNGRMLPVGNGAPLRLRVERQLGYKQAKYLMRIEAIADLRPIYGGKGGLWEDTNDYEWYAGI
ncbi:MAG TPA: molybdopterin-dependent oxidoreductase [Sphingomonas sp.]|jgi:DMSO/TMAO reductase YedYZ molybdopterin-dependent catalytic subunit|uniref:molybdopterin-dependent oxidoreductase n=1 Tax=Sphingomonas sp. TaxID=28214 RepID=UPI002ED9732D